MNRVLGRRERGRVDERVGKRDRNVMRGKERKRGKMKYKGEGEGEDM